VELEIYEKFWKKIGFKQSDKLYEEKYYLNF